MEKEPKLESIEDYKNEIKKLEKTSTIKNLIALSLLAIMIICTIFINTKNVIIHDILVISILITFTISMIFFGLAKTENNKIEKYKQKIEEIDTIKKAIKESKNF